MDCFVVICWFVFGALNGCGYGVVSDYLVLLFWLSCCILYLLVVLFVCGFGLTVVVVHAYCLCCFMLITAVIC